jgi:hypothetical protein
MAIYWTGWCSWSEDGFRSLYDVQQPLFFRFFPGTVEKEFREGIAIADSPDGGSATVICKCNRFF